MALTGDITGSLLASMSASGGVNGEIAFDGSGTDNYNELDNKPTINGVVLEGNKTSADLHISSEGTNNYNDLLNKPKINGTTLTGDVSDTQLQIDYNHLINKPDIPDISDIETRLDTAETDIDNLQSDVSSAEDNIDNILDDIASIKATDLTQNADISSLKNRVTSAETNISNLSTRVTNAESTISNHTTEISALDTRVGTAEGDITSLEGIVGDGHQSVGSDLTDAVTQLNSSLTNKEKNVGGIINAYWNDYAVTIEIAGAIPTEALSNTSTVVAVLPSEVPRPSTTKYGIMSCGGNSNRFVLLAIQSNGNMLVYNYSGASTSYLYGSITFLH